MMVSLIYNIGRYLSYIMDVATPTADCLNLVYDLLMPVVMKGHSRSTLSHQEVSPFLFYLSNVVKKRILWKKESSGRRYKSFAVNRGFCNYNNQYHFITTMITIINIIIRVVFFSSFPSL